MSSNLPPLDATQIKGYARSLTWQVVPLLCQTLVYGAYASYMPYALKIIFRKRPTGLMPNIARFVPIASFILSTLYFGVSFAAILTRIQIYFVELRPPNDFDKGIFHFSLISLMNMFHAIALLNFVITDGMVLWRALVICRKYSKVRYFLLADIGSLLLCLVFALVTIGARAAVVRCDLHLDRCKPLIQVIEVTQVLTIGWSFLTNIIATGCIYIRLRSLHRHEQTLRYGAEKSSSQSNAHDNTSIVNRTLTVLIEGGFVYCFAGLIIVICTLMPQIPAARLTLGTIILPSAVQFAGWYPALMMVAIHRHARQEEEAPRPSLSQFSFRVELSTLASGSDNQYV